ncbi:MAG: hypothetical protein K8T10_16480 [Candidatus Eremiobacteraeota bacterium]|nr:hypothetical protein [Candidatus Eremiobacteraeota bacterium]
MTNVIIVILITVAVLGAAFAIYVYIYNKRFNELSASLFFADEPIRIIETATKIKKGESVSKERTVVAPFDCSRAIFLIGRGITIRLSRGSRIKFIAMKNNQKTDEQFAEIELIKGPIWVTNKNEKDTVLIRYPVAEVKLVEPTAVELKTTSAGSLIVMCWEGFVSIKPSFLDETFEVGDPQRTKIVKTGAMARPYDIILPDMTAWEAWNLNTKQAQIIADNIPSMEKAFLIERKKFRIKGGFSGKLKLKPDTVISGKLAHTQWVEGGISEDGSVIISYRKDSVTKSGNKINLKIAIRNEGKVIARNVDMMIEALDNLGRIKDRFEITIPELEPLKSIQKKFEFEYTPGIANYEVKFTLPVIEEEKKPE